MRLEDLSRDKEQCSSLLMINADLWITLLSKVSFMGYQGTYYYILYCIIVYILYCKFKRN